jgi:HEPN domain-containing protein
VSVCQESKAVKYVEYKWKRDLGTAMYDLEMARKHDAMPIVIQTLRKRIKRILERMPIEDVGLKTEKLEELPTQVRSEVQPRREE